MSTDPMNNKTYVDHAGALCPSCRSDNIQGGRDHFENGSFWQECECAACGATWNDVYSLDGYEDLEIP